MSRSVKSWIYTGLKISNDVNAIRRGRVGRRVVRRAYGKLTGRLARRLLG